VGGICSAVLTALLASTSVLGNTVPGALEGNLGLLGRQLLAVGGINPLTQQRAISPKSLRDVLTVMFTCGLYEESGSWAYRVGVPARRALGARAATEDRARRSTWRRNRERPPKEASLHSRSNHCI
jgi:hypothetical protein